MLKKTLLPLIALILLFFIMPTCKNNPTGPTGPDTTGNNFEWRVDTLWMPKVFQITMWDIWGSSENDVWAVGHSSVSKAAIWHWDGETWQNIKPEFEEWGGLTHRKIFGFSKDDFWIVGGLNAKAYPWETYGSLLHYNNGSWELYPPEGLPYFLCIWGSASDNLYIGAFNGSIYHYNGTKLTRIKTGIEDKFESQVNTMWGFNENTVYAKASTYDTTRNTLIYYFYKVENQTATLVDSFSLNNVENQRLGNTLWGYNNELYSGTGEGIYKYVDEQWQLELPWTTIYDIYGSARNNIFAGAYGGGLFHYNGIDWKQINNFKSSGQTIVALWCNKDYVFLVQFLGNYQQIIQGKRVNS